MVFEITINKDREIVKSPQPSIECDRLVLFFSGIIYNKEFLKRSLRLEGNTIEEVLLEIFKTRPTLAEVVSKINGIFSIIVFDKDTGMIMALRDRNGFMKLKFISMEDGAYSFSETIGDDITPGIIFIFSRYGESSIKYNDYARSGKYWNDIRNRYITTKYKAQFKEISNSLAHLTTDQIIDFSPQLLQRVEYPEKVNMFKFLKRADMFKVCEYAKLRQVLLSSIKSIVNSFFKDDVIYILLDDDISTISIALLLSELGISFKTFSIVEEFKNHKQPYISTFLKTDHTVLPYNPTIIKYEIEDTLKTADNITIASVLPVYVLCKHINSLAETNANLILPTLSNEIFGGSFDSSVDDYTAYEVTINRLVEAPNFIIRETASCVDKFSLRAHYLYNDINICNYILFLNNKPRLVKGELQTRFNLKMAFSDVEDEELRSIIFSDIDTLTPLVRKLESLV